MLSDPPQVRLISFDAGGTLVYPHPPVGEVYAEALIREGLPADSEAIETRFREAFRLAAAEPRGNISDDIEQTFWRKIVRHALGDACPPDHFEDIFTWLWNEFASSRRWKVIPEAHDTIKLLRARGYRTVILSNADSRFRQVFGELRLSEHFEKLFISAELGIEKPNPEIFRHVETMTGMSGPSILHIGDSALHDGAAIDAGWQFLHFQPSPDGPQWGIAATYQRHDQPRSDGRKKSPTAINRLSALGDMLPGPAD